MPASFKPRICPVPWMGFIRFLRHVALCSGKELWVFCLHWHMLALLDISGCPDPLPVRQNIGPSRPWDRSLRRFQQFCEQLWTSLIVSLSIYMLMYRYRYVSIISIAMICISSSCGFSMLFPFIHTQLRILRLGPGSGGPHRLLHLERVLQDHQPLGTSFLLSLRIAHLDKHGSCLLPDRLLFRLDQDKVLFISY